MHQMKRFLWQKWRLLFIFKLRKHLKILVFYTAYLCNLRWFLNFFGSKSLYSFICCSHRLIFNELNSGIFQLTLVDDKSIIEFSDCVADDGLRKKKGKTPKKNDSLSSEASRHETTKPPPSTVLMTNKVLFVIWLCATKSLKSKC